MSLGPADEDAQHVLKHALKTERKLRDRNSQLVVPHKSFARVRTVCEQQLHLMRQPQPKHYAQPPTATPRVLFQLSYSGMLICGQHDQTACRNRQIANL